LIVPRIPLRTTLVERGIVILENAPGVRVDPPTSKPTSSQPKTLSEEEFYSAIDERRPGASMRLQRLVNSLSGVGIAPEFKRTLVLRWRPSEDRLASAGYIERSGAVWLGDGYHSAKNLGFPDAGDGYVNAIAEALGGKVNRSERGSVTVLGPDGRVADVEALVAIGDVWKREIARLIRDTAPSNDC